jgi:hypothetical protein
VSQEIRDLLTLVGLYVVGPVVLLGLWCEGMERLSRWYIRRVLRAGGRRSG